MAPRILILLSVLALATCAAARPGVGGDIDARDVATNEISVSIHVDDDVANEAKSDTAVKEAAKNEEAKPDGGTKELPKPDGSIKELPKPDSGVKDVPKPDAAKNVVPEPEAAKKDVPEVAKKDEAKPEAAKHEEPKPDAHKVEEAKPEAAKPETKDVYSRYPHAVLFGATCGGTIISPKWIITAAHCTISWDGGSVEAGRDYITGFANRSIIHPLFSVGPYWVDAEQFGIKQVAARWDFLLVELNDPLPLDGKKLAAVKLDDGPTIPEGLNVSFAGYGAESHGDYMRNEMHSKELEVLPDSECEKVLPEYNRKDMMCTRGRPPRFDSACNGDSGSGLVADGKLYGVTSWVQEDARRCFDGALVVFARVNSVRGWIKEVTGI